MSRSDLEPARNEFSAHGETDPDLESALEMELNLEPVQYGPGGERIELSWVGPMAFEKTRKALKRKKEIFNAPPRPRLYPKGLVLASVLALFVALVVGFITLHG